MAKSDSSKIAVRPRQKTIQTSALDKTVKGVGETFLHCEATRGTEEEALSRPSATPHLNDLQRHVATLERIGRDPEYLPDFPVRDRPARAIYGSALWAWIGRQPGITMTTKEVQRCLDAISAIEETRADMGLERE